MEPERIIQAFTPARVPEPFSVDLLRPYWDESKPDFEFTPGAYVLGNPGVTLDWISRHSPTKLNQQTGAYRAEWPDEIEDFRDRLLWSPRSSSDSACEICGLYRLKSRHDQECVDLAVYRVMYEQGGTLASLADYFERPQSWIRQRLLKSGVELRARGRTTKVH